ncbi:hypothetical protein PMAYCL1PPCAC_24759, partial [Pristionchus mayeri]
NIATTSIGVSTGASSGSIRWEVDKNSITSERKLSPSVKVGGIKWALCFRKSVDDENELRAFLCLIEGDYGVQSVDVSIDIILINHDDDAKTIIRKEDECSHYDSKHDSWGYWDLAKWSDVIDEGKGFIKNDKLTLHCDFSLIKIRGFRKHRRFNFTDPNEVSLDVALVIEGEKVYINKGYLSINSPIFQAMFYGDFAEKDKKEIEVKDIKKEEFLEMLNVIYPPHKKITDESVNFLAKLGDRFEIDMVMKAVEQFLIASETMSNSAKLLYADEYHLYKLQDHCLDQLTKPKDVKDLKSSIHYRDFSDAMIVTLFEKLTKLID